MKGLTGLVVVAALAACTRVEPRAATRQAEPAPEVGKQPPAPAKSAPDKPAARSFHSFTPSVHGFHFRNGFQGQVLGTGDSGYGLCGGMSFAAADYFLAERPIPADVIAPRDGTPLFKYIYSRQAASFGTLGSMGMKYIEWMQLPDDAPAGEESAHSRTLAELLYITRALSRGEPIVLGLVLTSTANKGKPWDNHQVLAFSASEVGDKTDIRIYDSNFPDRDDITISITREPAAIVQHIPGRGQIRIRGMFRMAYIPAAPPQ